MAEQDMDGLNPDLRARREAAAIHAISAAHSVGSRRRLAKRLQEDVRSEEGKQALQLLLSGVDLGKRPRNAVRPTSPRSELTLRIERLYDSNQALDAMVFGG